MPAQLSSRPERANGEGNHLRDQALGLRCGEALGQRWSDINWTARTVTIAGQVQRDKGKRLVWVAPKTDDSVAVLDAPEFVLAAPLVDRDRQQFLKTATGYLFTGASGQPLDHGRGQPWFRALLRAPWPSTDAVSRRASLDC